MPGENLDIGAQKWEKPSGEEEIFEGLKVEGWKKSLEVGGEKVEIFEGFESSVL